MNQPLPWGCGRGTALAFKIYRQATLLALFTVCCLFLSAAQGIDGGSLIGCYYSDPLLFGEDNSIPYGEDEALLWTRSSCSIDCYKRGLPFSALQHLPIGRPRCMCGHDVGIRAVRTQREACGPCDPMQPSARCLQTVDVYLRNPDLPSKFVFAKGSQQTLRCYQNKPVSDRFQFRWTHNNSVVLSHTADITFTARPDHAGIYKCGVQYEVDPLLQLWTRPLIKSNNSHVTVEQPPVASISPEVLHVLSGSLAHLDCEANGSYPLRFSWRRELEHQSVDHHYISGLSRVVIKDAGSHDEGLYTCVAHNIRLNINATTKPSRLTVYDPPQLTLPSSDIIATRGSEVLLSCSAYLDPDTMPAAISWWKREHLDPTTTLVCDKALIEGLSKFALQHMSGKFSIQENNKTLTSVSADDEGIWSCDVSSTKLLGCHWPYVENRLRLHVWEPPTVSISPKKHLVLVRGGGGVTLTCQAVMMQELQNKSLHITWYKDGEDIMVNAVHARDFQLNDRKRTVHLLYPLPRHSGKYQCSAMFEEVQSSRYVTTRLNLSDAVDITVQDPPQAKSSLQTLTVPIHQDVVTQCTAKGDGIIHTKWQRHFGSMVLDIPGTNSSSRDSLLWLKNVNSRDEGLYLCLAINSAIVEAKFQTSTATFTLIVGPPVEGDDPTSAGVDQTATSVPATPVNKLTSLMATEHAEQSSGGRSAVVIGAVFGLVSTLVVVIVLLVLLKSKPKNKENHEQSSHPKGAAGIDLPSSRFMAQHGKPFHTVKPITSRGESDEVYVGFFQKSGRQRRPSRSFGPRQMKKNRRLQAEVVQRLPASLLAPRVDPTNSFDTVTWSSLDTTDCRQSYAFLSETPHKDLGIRYEQDDVFASKLLGHPSISSFGVRSDQGSNLMTTPFSAPGYDDTMVKRPQPLPRQDFLPPTAALADDRLRLSSVDEEEGLVRGDVDFGDPAQDVCQVAPPAWLQEDMALELPLRVSIQGRQPAFRPQMDQAMEESNEYSIPYCNQDGAGRYHGDASSGSRLSLLGRRLSRLLLDTSEFVRRLGSASHQSKDTPGGTKSDEAARYSYPRPFVLHPRQPYSSQTQNSRYSCPSNAMTRVGPTHNILTERTDQTTSESHNKQLVGSNLSNKYSSPHHLSHDRNGFSAPLRGNESAPPPSARPILNRKFEFSGAVQDAYSVQSEHVEQPYSSYKAKTLVKAVSCQSLPLLRKISRRRQRRSRSLRSHTHTMAKRIPSRDHRLAASNEDISTGRNSSCEDFSRQHSPPSFSANERTRHLMMVSLAKQRSLSPVQIRDGRPHLRLPRSVSHDSFDELFDDDLDSYDHLDFGTSSLSTRQGLDTPDEIDGTAIYAALTNQRYRHIPQENICVMDEIGAGRFGYVYRAEWIQGSERLRVAVKVMKDFQDVQSRIDFLKEAAVMGRFRHANIVRLFGVVTGNVTMLVCELMVENLREYLYTIKPKAVISLTVDMLQHLLRICEEIASGMEYLARHGYVHRDLAARNVMLDKKGTCKIGDFGMSRVMSESDYYVSSGGVIPVKWTAPEAIEYRQFSSASDVWSYGVVLYEVWSFGEKPYGSWTNEKVLKEVSEGYRLPQPPHCPSSIDSVMRSCWATDYCNRPTFTAILQSLFATGEVLHFLVIEEDADYTDITPTQ